MGLKELRKTWDVDNWILRLFFRHMETPITKRLRTLGDDDSPVRQRSPSPGGNASTAGSRGNLARTEGANAFLPQIFDEPAESDLFDFDWTSASQFFNSKEAEDFSLFQLGSNPFGDENLQFAYDLD